MIKTVNRNHVLTEEMEDINNMISTIKKDSKNIAPSVEVYDKTNDALFAMLELIDDIDGYDYYKIQARIFDALHDLNVCYGDRDLTAAQKVKKLEAIKEEMIHINSEIYELKTNASELD
jgi:hypothetical protein